LPKAGKKKKKDREGELTFRSRIRREKKGKRKDEKNRLNMVGKVYESNEPPRADEGKGTY